MILIIDDDSAVRSSLSFMLKRAGYEVKTAPGPREAMDIVRAEAPALILMDMNFTLSTTGEEGLTLLKQVKVFRPDVPVILMTAWGSIQLAVQGMQAGAFDFITKPWNNAALLQRIETALELTAAPKEVPEEQTTALNRSHIIGKSKGLMEVLNTVARIARTNASVLITGESGTGKELIAEAIHINSQRVKQPFVKVNLGGISQSLFESEMFGHKKGAFTDASADRIGRFEMANKGTIFLDEIGDLDPSCQVKLLRVLQDQTFEVLGDSRPRKVDVRVVSATNADLRKMVSERTFREDLFYRINLITVKLPSLRERREDIPLLARHFADRQAEVNGLPRTDFSADALNFLSRLPYPGNIRELKNLVERTILVSGKPVLDATDFDAQYLRHDEPAKAAEGTSFAGMTLDEIERQTILQALEQHKGNLSQVAVSLGISRAALYRRLEKYNIHHVLHPLVQQRLRCGCRIRPVQYGTSRKQGALRLVGRKEVDVFQVLFVDLRRRRRIENHPHAQFGGGLYRVFHGFERYFELDQQIAGLRQFGPDVVDIHSGKPRIRTGSHNDAVFGRIIDRDERHTRRGLRIADDMRSIHLFRGVAGHQLISEKVGPDTRHEKGVAAQPHDGDGLIGAFAAGNDPEFAAENGLTG